MATYILGSGSKPSRQKHDIYHQRIGIRTVAVDGGNLMLNGAIVRLKGIELGPSNLTLSSNLIQAKQQLQKLLELWWQLCFH